MRLPDQQQWHALDRLLDELLGLEPAARNQRLQHLAVRQPELIKPLRRLLAGAEDSGTLDHILGEALPLLAELNTLPAQQRFGPWRLCSALGHGGMAQVFHAERSNGGFEQKVALKLLWPGLAQGDVLARFEQERQILASLDDPRIARLIDGGITREGRPWLAMEYVDGLAVDRYCDQHRLGVDQRLELFCQITAAVSTAHRSLVVHRDLKPANVLIETESGRVKLLDFGIAKMLDGNALPNAAPATRRIERLLTPEYASPEQLTESPITTATDIYQLGALLFELLTAQAPHRRRGLGSAEFEALVLASEAPRPSARVRSLGHDEAHSLAQARGLTRKSLMRRLRGDLDAIVERAMAREPKARYTSVDALQADIQAALTKRPVTARRGRSLYRVGRFMQRHRYGLALSALAGVTLLAGAAVYFEQTNRIKEEAETNQAVLSFLENVLYGGNPYEAAQRPLIPASVIEDTASRAVTGLADQPLAQVRVFNTLGQVYLSRGETQRSLELLYQARVIASAQKLTRELGRTQLSIAKANNWAGGYAEAEELLRTALAERQPGNAADIPATSQIRLHLADLLHSRGFYEQALEEANRALASGHYPAWSHRILGMILRDMGDYPRAEQRLLEALNRDHQLQAPHANIAAGLEHYGQLLLLTGRLSRAGDVLHEARRMRLEMLGPDWTGLIWTDHWLGVLALAEDDLETAERLLLKTVDAYTQGFSTASHLLAFARSDLGWALLKHGKVGHAEAQFGAAVEIFQQPELLSHPRRAEPLMGLAAVALVHGDQPLARERAAEALEIRRRNFAPVDVNHSLIVSACRLLIAADGQCREGSAPISKDDLDFLKIAFLDQPGWQFEQ